MYLPIKFIFIFTLVILIFHSALLIWTAANKFYVRDFVINLIVFMCMNIFKY